VKVNVIVRPKEAVLDPQGNAVRDAMRHLGMPEVRSVRIGKYMEINVDGEDVDLEKKLRGLCRDLLSNPVIEDYELQKAPASGPSQTGTKATARQGTVRNQPPARSLRRGAKSEVRKRKK
jgi:phosphoribosylformylglycinamidine synthase PurS subunit